jgi:hypothetical protein
MITTLGSITPSIKAATGSAVRAGAFSDDGR